MKAARRKTMRKRKRMTTMAKRRVVTRWSITLTIDALFTAASQCLLDAQVAVEACVGCRFSLISCFSVDVMDELLGDPNVDLSVDCVVILEPHFC
jgi:hypothetical protein